MNLTSILRWCIP